MAYERYFADIAGIEPKSLLDDWRWLLGDRVFSVWKATALGDLFLKTTDGAIWFLDMMEGKLIAFATDESDYEAKIADRHVRKNVLLSFLVRDLQAQVALHAGECYSPDIPPILGGRLKTENLKPTDIGVHASIMGQIHRQVKDLPAGTKIDEIRVEE